MAKDMVTFRMPDGTEVSNDPEFDAAAARQKVLDSHEYSGDAGIPVDEQKAQTQVERQASLNSGQPGVGDNAVQDDPTRDLHGPLGSPAQQSQKEDMEKAEKAEATPQSTSVDDAEPVDSNEEVLKVRERAQKRREAAQEALEDAGEGPGDPDKPYSEWTARQLKLEVATRNEGRDEADQLSLKGKRKPDVAAMLDEDDERQRSAGA